ncbi:cytochrome P450 [Cladochytrium replicatum]|nr:cytochrome P450 [Cladochytrium replicatum]
MANQPFLISLVAFGAAIAAFTLTWIGYLHVKMYRRGAAFQRVNPTMKIIYSSIRIPNLEELCRKHPPQARIQVRQWDLIAKHEPFADTQDDILAIITPFSTEVNVANAEAVREIALSRPSEYPKPVEMYNILSLYGHNVVTTEGDEWKRHRRVTVPHFNEKNNAYVHESTMRTLEGAFAKWKSDNIANGNDETEIDVHNMMFRVALSVISDAAFGVKFEFDGEGYVPPGFTFSFQRSLEILSLHLVEYIAFPKWAFKLPIQYLRDIEVGFSDFHRHMRSLVSTARTEKSEKANLLAALVKAADTESDEGKALSEEEMISNMFIFLFAGHETTANVLSYATAYMALRPEYQEKLYEETNKVISLDETPAYKHFTQLPFTMAIMNESMRLYPTVPLIPKVAGAGPSGTAHFQPLLGGKYQIPVSQNASEPDLEGTSVHISFIPLHYNPKYWGPDPGEFRPERWVGEDAESLNKYAWAPFSVGGRACLGKKFSQVEFVCALTMLNRYFTWRISPEMADEEVKKNGIKEEIEASALANCRKEIEKPERAITLKPGPVKLLFKRRTTA